MDTLCSASHLCSPFLTMYSPLQMTFVPYRVVRSYLTRIVSDRIVSDLSMYDGRLDVFDEYSTRLTVHRLNTARPHLTHDTSGIAMWIANC